MMPRTLFVLCAVLLCGMVSGCALLSKSEPLSPRYFTPEAASADTVGQVTAPHALKLRLGYVHSGSQLRERIIYRDSAHELAYYEDRRWTERPEAFVRRALERALFERRGFVRVLSGAAPTLSVELVAFEEVRAPQHTVRVRAIVMLDDDRVGSAQETVTVERPVVKSAGGDDAVAVVEALSAALQQCVEQVADHVSAKLIPPS